MKHRTSCPGCGNKLAPTTQVSEYKYRESGLPGIVLRGGVTRIACDECGAVHFQIEKEGQLLQTIALGLLMKKSHLTGKEMRFLRGACNLTQSALASRLELRRETIAEREAKPNPRLTQAEEVWFRIVVLGVFVEYLQRPARNQLGVRQVENLEAFAAAYYKEAKDLFRGVRRVTLSVKLKRGDEWIVERFKHAA